MISVLVTAVGGDIAQGVITSLRISSLRLNIIGTDTNEYAAGLFLVDSGYIIPSAKNEDIYIKKMIDICNKNSIDIVFPCNEIEQKVIAGNITMLNQATSSYFVVHQKSVLDISQDKKRTFEFLKKHNILTPKTLTDVQSFEEIAKTLGLPFIIKSQTGAGSKYFHIIRDNEEYDTYAPLVSKPVFQEYITNDRDEEYTVGLFLDEHSRSLGEIVMLRKLRSGWTKHAIAGDFSDVRDIAVRTAETVRAIGPCNIQLRKDKNNLPVVIEINARISGTVALRSRLGFNEVAAAIDYFINDTKPHLSPKAGVAMKTWGELIVPVTQFEKLRKNKKIHNA